MSIPFSLLVNYQAVKNIINARVFQLSRKAQSDKESVKEWAETYLRNEKKYKVFYENKGGDSSLLLSWVAPWQEKILIDAEEWCIDSTHKSCKSVNNPMKDGYLYTIVVRSPATNRGVPVCYFITDNEIILNIHKWLAWLNTQFSLNVKRIMIDCSPVEIAAVKEAFGDNVDILLCHWHIKRAWETNLKKLVSINELDCIFIFSNYIVI
jgi:hypothetical protein